MSKSDIACVNALGGLFSFLLRDTVFHRKEEKKGVNALGGLFSFLLPSWLISINYNFNWVSMPSAGYSHFYPEPRDDVLKEIY